MITRRHYLNAYAVFAIGLIAIVAAMAPDFRAAPIYQRLTVGPSLPPPPGFHDGKTLSIEFDAPAEDLNRLHWYGMIYHPLHEMDFSVRNLSRDRDSILVDRLVRGDPEKSNQDKKSQQSTPEDQGDGKWHGDNRAGDRLRFELRWRRDTPPKFPTSIVLARKGDPESARQSIPLRGWPQTWPPETTLAVAFDAPAAGYGLIDLPGITDDHKTRVKIELFNLTTGKSVKKYTLTGAPEDLGDHGMTPGNAAGDRLELRLRWQRVPPPALHLSGASSQVPIEVQVDGEAVDFQPLLGLDYAWPTRQLLWLWIPILALIGLALIAMARGKLLARPALSRTTVILVLAGLMASIASCLSWQQAVATETSHLDPDGFGRYAGQLVEWLHSDSPERRAGLESTMDTWRYSWLPVTPLLIAAQLLCGVPFSVAYVLVAALASFGTVLLFHLLLRRYLGLGELAALAGTLLLLSHHFFLKSFAKPSTDPVCLLLVMAGLCLVCERLRVRAGGGDPDWKNALAIGLVVFLHFGARPPGFLMAGFLVSAVLLADAWSCGRVKIGPTIIDSLRLGLAPALLFGALFVGFDWLDNFQTALHSNESYHHVSTARRFGIMSVSMLIWLPLL